MALKEIRKVAQAEKLDDVECGICGCDIEANLYFIKMEDGETFLAHEICWENSCELFEIKE